MIPYNPSSFNSNKTILEQILELKNWLKDHPQYEVYYCNDNASLYPFMNTFSLANVPDNTNMDVGDLVVCNNAVYCTVISIDRDNGVFTAGYGVSFKGDTGAAGQQGYSLRVSSENYVDDVTAYHRNSLEPSHGTRENDTILFANGYVGIVTSLGAGATYYVTNRTVSFVGPQGPEGPQGPQGPQGPTGATGPQGVSITNVAIDGNQHLIVTLSDGSTIDAGSVSSGGTFDHYATITTISGTLSLDDFNKLLYEDSVLIHKVNSTTINIFRKISDDGSNLNFEYINVAIGTMRFTIDKVSRVYSRTLYGFRSGSIDSQTATNGQVLTANGSGGASWQTPSGAEVVELTGSSGTLSDSDFAKVQNANTIIKIDSDYYIHTRTTTSHIIYDHFTYNISWTRVDNNHLSIVISSKAWTLTNNRIPAKQLYEHNIVLYKSGSFSISFKIINTTSTAMSQSDVGTYLANNSANNVYLVASGSVFSSPNLFAVISICLINGNLYTRYLNTSGNEAYINQGTFSIMSVNLNDNVITL